MCGGGGEQGRQRFWRGAAGDSGFCNAPPHTPIPAHTVWVKVVEVDAGGERGPRIGCSIKLVSQSDGTDMDPANSRYRPRGEGGAPGGGGGQVCEGGGGVGSARGCCAGGLRGSSIHPLLLLHTLTPPPPHTHTRSPLQAQPPIGARVAEAKGGEVDWGYLKADVVQVRAAAGLGEAASTARACCCCRCWRRPPPPSLPPPPPAAVRQGCAAVRATGRLGRRGAWALGSTPRPPRRPAPPRQRRQPRTHGPRVSLCSGGGGVCV